MATFGETIATAIPFKIGVGQVIQCYHLLKRENILALAMGADRGIHIKIDELIVDTMNNCCSP
ncbi:MAG: hypothetical protein BA862_14630 [Desulfobulbaceae bacterium S3730MH12]|nr:MAG: hypothetical protein BA862_14630 [Desulfobulbaceae bacterium S3730MH12]OEU81351.1 MAG: hypothetical protein BA873_13405 [Desulfobulbaceae bacterium C00003063]